MKKRPNINWLELVEGVLLIVLGIFSFIRPNSVMTGLVVLYGIVAVITGISDIIFYVRVSRHMGFGPTVTLITGVLGVMSGCMILVYPGAGKWILSLLFPIWFIAHCISGLSRLNALRLRVGKAGYYIALIVNIVGLILGFLMIFRPFLSILSAGYVIGAYLVLLGAHSVVLACNGADRR